MIKELHQVVEKLKTSYKPEKIILFGSLANGRIKKWSDIDLAIIKKTKKRFLDRLEEVALLCDYSVGIDFLVYTPEEFEQMKSEKRYFITDEIIKKGKVMYERK